MFFKKILLKLKVNYHLTQGRLYMGRYINGVDSYMHGFTREKCNRLEEMSPTFAKNRIMGKLHAKKAVAARRLLNKIN